MKLLRKASEPPIKIAMQRCKDLRREYQRKFWEVRAISSVGKAYSAADQLSPEIAEAYKTLFDLMPNYNSLRAGSSEDLEKAFEFCETDVLAFRCGYEKSEIYGILKSIQLTPKYAQRVRDLVMSYVRWPGFRREMEQLSRLGIVVANEELVKRLVEIVALTDEKTERQKTAIFLYKILNGRPEYRAMASLSETLKLTRYKNWQQPSP